MSNEDVVGKGEALGRLGVGGGIAIIAMIVALYNSDWIKEYRRGAKKLSTEEVHALEGQDLGEGKWVTIQFDELIDTELVYARQDKDGNQDVVRHYFIGRLGDRWLIISERPDAKANPLTGTLEKWDGDVATEAIGRVKSKYPQHSGKFLSFQMSAEGAFEGGAVAIVVVCVLAFIGGLIWAGTGLYHYSQAEKRPRRRKRRRSRQQEYDYDDDAF